jgi:hypothetical protein
MCVGKSSYLGRADGDSSSSSANVTISSTRPLYSSLPSASSSDGSVAFYFSSVARFNNA